MLQAFDTLNLKWGRGVQSASQITTARSLSVQRLWCGTFWSFLLVLICLSKESGVCVCVCVRVQLCSCACGCGGWRNCFVPIGLLLVCACVCLRVLACACVFVSSGSLSERWLCWVVVQGDGTAAVTVGPRVHLLFTETQADAAADNAMVGVHLCIYIANFSAVFDRLHEKSLTWTNPRFAYLDRCDTKVIKIIIKIMFPSRHIFSEKPY